MQMLLKLVLLLLGIGVGSVAIVWATAHLSLQGYTPMQAFVLGTLPTGVIAAIVVAVILERV